MLQIMLQFKQALLQRFTFLSNYFIAKLVQKEALAGVFQ